jgi:hypothetical protein
MAVELKHTFFVNRILVLIFEGRSEVVSGLFKILLTLFRYKPKFRQYSLIFIY